MKAKDIEEILDKYYSPYIKKEVAKMKAEAQKLTQQLKKDPNNKEIAIRLALNPFNKVVECDFLGTIGILNEVLRELD